MQGGVGDCTNELAKALAKLDVEVHVLTTDDRRRTTDENRFGAYIHRKIQKWNWGSIQIVRRTLNQIQPDILHIQYQTAAFGMHPAINFTPRALQHLPFIPSAVRMGESRVRAVTTFHDLKVPYLFPKAGRVREWITYELARSSDAVIATNGVDRVRLENKITRIVRRIPIGSNIAPAPPPDFNRAQWRERLGIAPDTTLLAYFGFLNESKGATDLMRALREVVTRGLDAKLLMIGGQVGASDPTNVAYLAQVKALVNTLGLSENVLWTDYAPAEQVSANLLACDIGVLPYRDGASPRRGSFMAALAHGLPIVTTGPKAEGGRQKAKPKVSLKRMLRIRYHPSPFILHPFQPCAMVKMYCSFRPKIHTRWQTRFFDSPLRPNCARG